MWDLPGPGLKPVSPALAGGFPNHCATREASDFLKILFIFGCVLGLCCCTWAFSSRGERGLRFVEARGLLIAVASLVAEHRHAGSVVVAHRL